MAEMNQDQRRKYNREKQALYRFKRRGKPRKYTKGTAFFQRHMTTEEIFGLPGHCSFCGMLLSSEYHKVNKLVGCLKALAR